MIGLALAITELARASEPTTLRSCEDEPAPGDVAWAVARTVSVEQSGSLGTGTVVSADGAVLTAAHVVAGADRVEVVFADGRRVPAVVARLGEGRSDLALLRSPGTDWPCMPLRDAPADVGSDVLVIGSPGGSALSHSVSKGIVSGYRRVHDRTLVQTDAANNRGNSGGPLVSDSGELIGVVSFKLVGDGVEGLGFATASTDVPAALGLRWGPESDPVPTAPAPLQIDSFAPTVELGPGVTLDLDRRYRMGYAPRPRPLAAGLATAAAGAVLAGVSNAIATRDRPITRAEWSGWVATNTIGWAMVAAGGTVAGLGVVIPSDTGPIRTVEPR